MNVSLRPPEEIKEFVRIRPSRSRPAYPLSNGRAYSRLIPRHGEVVNELA